MEAWRQAGFEVRFDWGQRGADALAAGSDVIVVVDVLSFSTAVEVATSRGAVLWHYAFRDPSATRAGRGAGDTAPLARLLSRSPHGASISQSMAQRGLPVLVGGLRNAAAVARVCGRLGPRVTVIAAGEQWPDGSLRPAVEDLLGAGAILDHLGAGALSPEAEAARGAFRCTDVARAVERSGSGRELIAAGFAEDVRIASAVAISTTVPRLVDGAFVAA